MAHSGVTVDSMVDECVQKMLLPSKIPKSEQLKLLVLCLSDDLKSIVVDEKNTRRMEDLCSSSDAFCEITKLFKDDECRYAIYDCSYESKDCGCKKDLVFISWSPDSAEVKKKMLHSASVESIKRRFHNIRHYWHLSDPADWDKMELAEKFGTKGSVTQLEGVPLCHGVSHKK